MSEEKLYQCNKCHRFQSRKSNRKTIKSYCGEMVDNATLTRVDDLDKVVKGFRRRHLKYCIDLSTFKPKDRKFIEYAFERGATIMFNSFKPQST